MKAEIASSIIGNIFTISILPEVIKKNDIDNFLKFRFYAVEIDADKEFVTEWLKPELVKKETEYLLKNIKIFLPKFEELKNYFLKESIIFKKTCDDVLRSLESIDDKNLAKEYYSFVDYYSSVYGRGAITFIYESELAKYFADLLRKKGISMDDVAADLKHNYKSFIIESEELLLKIKKAKSKENLIKEYLDKFYFIDTNYQDIKILKSDDVIKKSLDAVEQEFNVKEPSLDLPGDLRGIIKIIEYTEIIRDKRKYVNLLGSYIMFKFLERLQKIIKKDVKKIFWNEFDLCIKNPSILDKAQKRKIVDVIYNEGKVVYLEEKELFEEIYDVGELTGITACGGKVEGVVKVIKYKEDFEDFKKGTILVTHATRPDFMPIISKSAAIITEEGGITSHAAIVSRELGIPCIVGVKKITEILKDGDKIEVDADKGVVKKLK